MTRILTSKNNVYNKNDDASGSAASALMADGLMKASIPTGLHAPLLVRDSCSQLPETMGRSVHLERLFKYDILVNLNYHSEAKRDTVHTKQGQEIASEAAGTLFTRQFCSQSISECLLILSYTCFSLYST